MFTIVILALSQGCQPPATTGNTAPTDTRLTVTDNLRADCLGRSDASIQSSITQIEADRIAGITPAIELRAQADNCRAAMPDNAEGCSACANGIIEQVYGK